MDNVENMDNIEKNVSILTSRILNAIIQNETNTG